MAVCNKKATMIYGKGNIIVPEGMMNDIVRPLWDDTVIVTGTRLKNKIHLKDISKAPE
jgi:hypothetical protein